MRRLTQFLILAFVAILIIPVFLPHKIEASVEKEFHFPVEVLFGEFNNLNEFAKWEPWASDDSLAEQDFFSPYKGKGAGYQWSSKDMQGILTITDVVVNKNIEYTLEGYDLNKGSLMRVDFSPVDSTAVRVRWTIESDKIGYFSRYYSSFTSENLKDRLNKGFEKLEKLLAASPQVKPAKKSALNLKTGEIKTESFEGLHLISVTNETTLDKQEMKTAFEESNGLIRSYLIDFLKIPESDLGNPIVYFDFIDKPKNRAKFSFGYPVNENIKAGEGMELQNIPASNVLVSLHKGGSASLGETLNLMKNYSKKNKLNLSNTFWQELPKDFQSIKKLDDLETKVYIPIKD